MGVLWIKIAKRLDRITDKLVDIYADIREAISPGYKVKNKSGIDELKLMLRAFNRSPLAVFGAILVFIFVFLGIFGPVLAPEPYWEVYVYPKNQPPGWKGHIFGTDYYGRDLFSVMLCGARMSMMIGFMVILLGVPLGIILGLAAAYYGGKIDEIIMRLVDIFYSFPSLVLAIALAATLPSKIDQVLTNVPVLVYFFTFLFGIRLEHGGYLGSTLAIIIAMAIVWWPGYTRMIRAVALSEREKVYVEAAKALGLSDRKIMFKHILPNISSIVLVMITIDLGSIIILEAALSFLGLGPQPPLPEIGRLISDGRTYWPSKWWLIIIPGAFLFIVGLGWNLLGDALRDVMDPKTRRSIEFGVKERPLYYTDIMGVIGNILIIGGFVVVIWVYSDIPGMVLLTAPIFVIYALWPSINSNKKLEKIFAGQIIGIVAYYLVLQFLSAYSPGIMVSGLVSLAGIILNMIKEKLEVLGGIK
ncbi:MAG: ABC transporter permease [Candidatus Njordarchaeota archaeon]